MSTTSIEESPGGLNVRDIVARVLISDLWRDLGGPELRRTGPSTYRGPAWWRDGDGLNVSLDDSRGVFFDFVAGAGGGILDLIVCVHGASRQDALRWLADQVGAPRNNRPLSEKERTSWNEREREIALDLPQARYWRRSAIAMTEELLDVLKVALCSHEAEIRPAIGEIHSLTRQLASLQHMEDAALVDEYRWWMAHSPRLTAGMVQSGRMYGAAEQRALRSYLELRT